MHTLLLDDDSVTIQRVIELTFADEDVRVVAVSDGQQAIAVLEQEPPDIVLADVSMPGRSGYEVAEHVKGTPRLAHIPVVLLTGVFEEIDQARASAAGCDGILAKPFEPHVVVARVMELLGRSTFSQSSPERPSVPSLVAVGPWVPQPDDGSLETDSYFDHLDAAFASLAGPREQVAATPRPAAAGPHLPPFENPPSADAAPQPEPVSTGRPASVLPSLADAFAALLAAEQRSGATGAPLNGVWPGPALAPMRNDFVEEVARRVLDRLSDSDLRDTIVEIVSNVAERLVLEEIERIKASIK